MANRAVTYDRDGTWLWHGQSFAAHVEAARSEIEPELERDVDEFWNRKPLPPNQCFWADGRYLSPYWKAFWEEQSGVENRGSQLELDVPLDAVLTLVGG